MNSRVKKVFSINLFIIYTMVIFQNGFVQGIHFLSHSSDILSSQFTYHSHGNGKSHVHHHGFLETIKTLLEVSSDKQQQDKPKHISNTDTQIKFHLPGCVLVNNDRRIEASSQLPPFLDAVISVDIEVLLPPPKNMLVSL